MDHDDKPAHPTPRFVPTLTEVVETDTGVRANPPNWPSLDVPEDLMRPEAIIDESATARASHPAGGPEAKPAAVTPPAPIDATVDQVLARLGPQLDRQISETIARVLHEQMLGLNGRVQKAVAEVVRDAVTKALVQGSLGPDVGKNP